LSAKRTVLIISIIEVIAIIVIIVSDIFVATVVPNDDHVPEFQESYEEPRDDPSGTRTPPTPAVSPSHDAMRCRVEDGDATAENWEDSHGDSLPADRFWNIASECNIAADDVGPCMGIELNILEQAKVTFAIIRTIIIIAVIDIFSVDIMIFQFCTGPALHSAHVGGRWRPA
jgi:hypothetical protein